MGRGERKTTRRRRRKLKGQQLTRRPIWWICMCGKINCLGRCQNCCRYQNSSLPPSQTKTFSMAMTINRWPQSQRCKRRNVPILKYNRLSRSTLRRIQLRRQVAQTRWKWRGSLIACNRSFRHTRVKWWYRRWPRKILKRIDSLLKARRLYIRDRKMLRRKYLRQQSRITDL